MDMLKKFFPYAFKVGAKDTNNLVVSIVLHLVAGLIVTLVLFLLGLVLGLIPVIDVLFGIVAWVVGSVIDLYCLAAIVLSVLLYFDVLK